MTAKFFNGKTGGILDFTNQAFSTSHIITEEKDMYYQVDFDNYERTYQIYKYSGGTRGDRVGISSTGLTTAIEFYEKGGGIKLTKLPITTTPSPTPLPTTPTPTPLPGTVQYWYHLKRCDVNVVEYSIRYNLNTFSIGQIVYGHDTKHYYTVTGSTATTNSNPGTPNILIDTTTYTRCEDTPYYTPPTNRSMIVLVDMPFYSGQTELQIVKNICGKSVSQITGGTTTTITGWTIDNPYVYGTSYSLYTTSTGSTVYVGADRYYGVVESGVVASVVFVSSNNSINNLYSWMSCGNTPGGSCFGYANNTPYTSIVDYQECNTNIWKYSASVPPNGGICAVYGTVTVLSGGDLTNTNLDCKWTPTPSPTPISTYTPTPTPTQDPSLPTPTPTPTSGSSPSTSTPTPTAVPPTVTPTPVPTYVVTGTYDTSGTVNGVANGTLTVNSGTVTVTLKVFSGTCSGCSNTGYLTGDMNLSLTSTNTSYAHEESQSFTKGVGVYDFTITSNPSSDYQKYAKLTFS